MKSFVYTGGVNVPDVTPRIPARQLLIGDKKIFFICAKTLLFMDKVFKLCLVYDQDKEFKSRIQNMCTG